MVEKLCGCGCGEIITIKSHHKWYGVPDYIHGHNSRNDSKETKALKIKALDKLKNSPGYSKRQAESSRKRFSDKKNHPMFGKKHSEDTKKRMSESRKGKVQSEETKRKHSEAIKGIKRSEKTKKLISNIAKKRYLNPTYVKKMAKAWGLKPNRPELLLMDLLNKLYPGHWKYTGDFSFTINGKCPDFVNCNGQKKIIELFGDYWHQGENPQNRADLFKPFGYDTLVIWEHELKHMESVVNRIHGFMVE